MTTPTIDTNTITTTLESPPKSKRGFAGMDRAKVSAIASKGGKAAHAIGTAHTFTPAEAKAAGQKGGAAPHVRRGRGPVEKKVEAAS